MRSDLFVLRSTLLSSEIWSFGLEDLVSEYESYCEGIESDLSQLCYLANRGISASS